MLIVVIRMNYIVFGISLRIQLVLDTEALAACLGGLKCQGDVEAEELSKLVMEHCHFEPAIYDELNTCIEFGNLNTMGFFIKWKVISDS